MLSVRLLSGTNIRLKTSLLGTACPIGDKGVSPIEEKLIFRSVVKVSVRVRVRQVDVMVRVGGSLQEITVSLCNVPKSDLGQQQQQLVCV